MKLDELNVRDSVISELIPPTAGSTTMAPGQQIANDPAAQRKMQAQQALNRQEQRKATQDAIRQTQDEIRQKQEELQNLRQQLAQIR